MDMTQVASKIYHLFWILVTIEKDLVNILYKQLSKICVLDLSKFYYMAPDLLSTGVSDIFQMNFFNERNITYTN